MPFGELVQIHTLERERCTMPPAHVMHQVYLRGPKRHLGQAMQQA